MLPTYIRIVHCSIDYRIEMEFDLSSRNLLPDGNDDKKFVQLEINSYCNRLLLLFFILFLQCNRSHSNACLNCVVTWTSLGFCGLDLFTIIKNWTLFFLNWNLHPTKCYINRSDWKWFDKKLRIFNYSWRLTNLWPYTIISKFCRHWDRSFDTCSE